MISDKIKLFLTDVDGVLTDGTIYYSPDGELLKSFHTKDGMAFELARKQGLKTGIVTSEITPIVERRAEKVKADFLRMGSKGQGKLEVTQQICKELEISLEEVAYIGDDINCKELLSAVGFKACPSDALEQVKAIDGICIMQKPGGQGVVREWFEYLNNQ